MIIFFLCFSNNMTPVCLVNNYLYEFDKIACEHSAWSLDYEVLYFKETDDFMLISRLNLHITMFNNANNSLKECKKKICLVSKKMFIL